MVITLRRERRRLGSQIRLSPFTSHHWTRIVHGHAKSDDTAIKGPQCHIVAMQGRQHLGSLGVPRPIRRPPRTSIYTSPDP